MDQNVATIITFIINGINLVVKELCFKHLQNIITTYVHDITMLLSHNQPYSQCIFSL